MDGHSDYRTTSIYPDYAPDPSQGAEWAAKAFGALMPPGAPAPEGLMKAQSDGNPLRRDPNVGSHHG
jgi:hypothetical protein